MQKRDSTLDLIAASGLGVISFIALATLILLNSRGQGDQSTQSTNINNLSPSVEITSVIVNSVALSESTKNTDCSIDSCVNLIEGSTSIPVVIWGTATDPNGYKDISDADGPSGKWTAKLFRSDLDSNCGGSAITNGDCVDFIEHDNDIIENSDSDVEFLFTSTVPYYMTPTDEDTPTYSVLNWIAYVMVEDVNSRPGAASDTFEFEVNTLIALRVESKNAQYTKINVGEKYSETVISIANKGNRDIDYYIKSGGPTPDIWKCDKGTFPISALKYSTKNTHNYNDGMTALTSSSKKVDANIPKGSHNNTGNLYGMLQIPSGPIGGTCTAQIVFTAVAGN
ncbi:hypothetical protein KBD59_04460 [Candidatus Gracilibacteria bacterium]|nr:hypothetical protein [Candidatus Gracilibacteria bacterium]